MSLFTKVKSAKTEKAEDRLGGFVVHPSNVYDAEVVCMYGVKSDKGSLGVTVELDLFLDPDSDKPVRHTETIYVTNQNGENFYESKKDNRRYMNSGWLLVDAIALFATNMEAGLGELETEEFHYKRKKDGKEISVKTESYPEVVGLALQVGLLKVVKPKQIQVDNEYVDVDTGETTESNTIDRIFNEEGFTIIEWEAEKEEPEFIDKWLKTWEGKDKIVKPKIANRSKRTAGNDRANNARRAPASTGRNPRFTRK